MDSWEVVSICSIILSFYAWTASFSTSFALDRPIHTIVIAFALTGVLLLLLVRIYPSYYISRKPAQKSTPLPLQQFRGSHSSRDPSLDSRKSGATISRRSFRIAFLLTLIFLIARIEVLRRTLNEIECIKSGVECIAPFILAIHDYYTFRRKEDRLDKSPNPTVLQGLKWNVVHSRFRFLYVGFLYSWGSYLAISSLCSVDTTYICPTSLPHGNSILVYQWVGVTLDCFILASAGNLLLPDPDQRPGNGCKGAAAWGWILLTCALFWSCVGALVYRFKPENRSWLVSLEPQDVQSVIGLSVLFAFTGIGASRALPQLGILYLSALFIMEFVFINLAASIRYHTSFPPRPSSTIVTATALMCFGYEIIRRNAPHGTSSITQTTSKFRPSIGTLILFTYLALVILELFRSNVVDRHPIDILLFDANVQHSHWTKQATQSRTLNDAVKNYKERYNTYPPPGFDKWYKYAKKKSSIIIDDYDQIYNDLVPFWSMSAGNIRQTTWEMVSNPWNEISGISIRDGEAFVQENVLPTHRWMLEGVAKMINQFSKYLPDMDLGFNLNDECRVAVPWSTSSKYKETAVGNMKSAATAVSDSIGVNKASNWSENRSKTWKGIDKEHPISTTIFENHSFTRNFYNFGTVSCPPSSRARKDRYWDPRVFCDRCTSEHSIGQFLSNWSHAADPCHQPDLANLHGFYLSPAAFKTSHELMPVFSQSKVHGYHDILYPSSWNYMDKVKYDPSKDHPDPPFAEKQNTLFWRGATSEGVSAEGTWKGMARQRVVHLTNNLTSPARQSHRHALLLPHPSRSDKLQYQNFPASSLASLGLNTSVHVVSEIVRSGGHHDGPDQAIELAPLVEPSDFQHHWQYRYLFDLDGAGFSGRFLPFLQSRSLPFKSALFREWYDDRITAWLHFVPQDLRLHAVWSTLAYFAGVDGKVGSRRIKMAPHKKEGAMIAEKGREWAGKVLRKEDMEVYFFRLLLEWGRLTDERRDEIGFVG